MKREVARVGVFRGVNVKRINDGILNLNSLYDINYDTRGGVGAIWSV